MTKESSTYWKGKSTYKLSKTAHALATKVAKTDAPLGQQMHDAIAALDANADALVQETAAERDAFNDALSNLHEDLSGLVKEKEGWEREKAELLEQVQSQARELEKAARTVAALKAGEAEADSVQARQEERLQVVERKAGIKK